MRCFNYQVLTTFSLALGLLTGCSHHYVLKMSNNSRVTTASKPKLEHGYWTFKDAQGRPQKVPAGRVLEVAPASMASDENSKFKAPSQK